MKRKVFILISICLSMITIFAGCQTNSVIKDSQVAASGLECQIKLYGGKFSVEKNTNNYDFNGWDKITSISASPLYLGGIKNDGTVVITSYSGESLNTNNWKNISMLELTLFSAYGLTKDGQIIFEQQGKSKVDNAIEDKISKWKDITYIDTGNYGIVGVQKNGRIEAALTIFSDRYDLEDKVSQWTDIKMASISVLGPRARIVGLKNNGEIVEARSEGQLIKYKLDSYKELNGAIKICAGDIFTAGLMYDGTLRVKCGEDYKQQIKDKKEGIDYIDLEALDNTKDVLDINSFEDTLVVLKKDGTVLVAGFSEEDNL